MILSRRALFAATTAFAWGSRAWAQQLIERSPRPQNYETPIEVFSQRITPTESFYIRSHFDTPTIDLEKWRLTVDGLEPGQLSLSVLLQMPHTTVEAVLQCAGNGRGMMRPRVPGVQWMRGAMGNATWRGVRLRDILARTGVGPEMKHLVVSGYDRPTLPATPPFVRSIPIARALDANTLVATHMNGHPIPLAHGGPARLVVPGWVGDDWVKWLERITPSPEEAKGFFFEKGYRFPDPPGAPGEPVPPERMHPMTTLNVKSVIARPRDGAVEPIGPCTVTGVAFSNTAIKMVEVSIDGTTWKRAKLESATSPYGFRVFEAEVKLKKPGRVRISARATDESGAVQPVDAVWNPSGYLHNAIDLVEIEVRQ